MESEEGNTKPSQVDRIFKQALREFKDNLVATYSIVNKQGGVEVLNIKYKDLIANFIHVSGSSNSNYARHAMSNHLARNRLVIIIAPFYLFSSFFSPFRCRLFKRCATTRNR